MWAFESMWEQTVELPTFEIVPFRFDANCQIGGTINVNDTVRTSSSRMIKQSPHSFGCFWAKDMVTLRPNSGAPIDRQGLVLLTLWWRGDTPRNQDSDPMSTSNGWGDVSVDQDRARQCGTTVIGLQDVEVATFVLRMAAISLTFATSRELTRSAGSS